ncbi:Gfo/Idh/MocA family oxidoreductase [Pseudalkalibacillus sp. SCS-8]|uniref:Gfo/Idh/MocA family protein n=1 Tax=Pseudalkalibacillus nanhaiensis TaxID=3115291 RepID=UPI0032DB1CBB
MKFGIMSFAHMHAYSYADCLNQMPGVHLSGISDDDPARGEEAARKYDVPYYESDGALLATDVDAVIICSENVRHKEMVLQAAEANKHILCEKPIATSTDDAWEMIEACKKAGVKLMTAFPVRYSTPIQKLKTYVEEGHLGTILSMRTTNRGQNPGGWFIETEKSGGGAVLDHTVHMIDIMRWLMNSDVSKVYAEVDTLFTDKPIDDCGLMTLAFENGVLASHDPSWSKNPAYPTWGDATIEVVGTKGRAYADAFGETLHFYSSKDEAYRHVLFGKDMDYGLLEDFVKCVKEDLEPSVTGLDGLRAMEVALAAYESGRSHQEITIR